MPLTYPLFATHRARMPFTLAALKAQLVRLIVHVFVGSHTGIETSTKAGELLAVNATKEFVRAGSDSVVSTSLLFAFRDHTNSSDDKSTFVRARFWDMSILRVTVSNGAEIDAALLQSKKPKEIWAALGGRSVTWLISSGQLMFVT